MKTIETAASDHVRSRALHSSISNMESFKEGAKFAQQWISVEDELPEASKESLGIFYSEYVLIKVSGYEHPFIGYYVKACDDEFFDFISESTSKSIKQIEITHWRPIEYK
jgi:Protein of unknown function (DUF551).